MKKCKRCAALALVLCLFCLCFAGCGNVRLTTKISGRDLLKSDRETLSIGEAKLYLMTLTNEYKTLYDFNMWDKLEGAGNTEGEEALKTYVKNRTMERVQNVFCMYLFAKSKELALSDTENAQIQEAAEEFYATLSDEEREYLEISEEDVVKAYTHYTLANQIYLEMTGDQVKQISDDKARVMTANVIYLKDGDQAKEVESKLKEGADFASLAAMYTTLDSVLQNISRDRFPDDLVEAAFGLEEGEVSGKITANGYYFVQCISRFDEELTKVNRERMELELRETTFDEAYEEYLKTIYLQVSDEIWDEVEVRTDEAIGASGFFTVYNSYFAK